MRYNLCIWVSGIKELSLWYRGHQLETYFSHHFLRRSFLFFSPAIVSRRRKEAVLCYLMMFRRHSFRHSSESHHCCQWGNTFLRAEYSLAPVPPSAHPSWSKWRRSNSQLAFYWFARGSSDGAHHHKSPVLTRIWQDKIDHCSIVIQRETEVNWWRTTFKLKDKTLAFLPLCRPKITSCYFTSWPY